MPESRGCEKRNRKQYDVIRAGKTETARRERLTRQKGTSPMRGSLTLLALSLLLARGFAAEASPKAADGMAAWPTFHADNSRSGAVPVDFEGPPFSRLWTFNLGPHTWRYCKGASVWSACAIAAPVGGKMRVFVGAYDHNVYCLDALTGKEIWRFTTGCIVNSAPVLAEIGGRPMVFVASADRCFYGLDARDGKRIWVFETYPWTYTVGESIAGSPLVAELDGRPTLFATMWNSDKRPLRTVQRGELFALDPATGEAHWRQEISTQPLTSPCWGEVDGRPRLFLGSRDGALYVLDPQNGKQLWSYVTDHTITATPVFTHIGGQPVVLVANHFGMLRCFSARTHHQLWRYKAGHEILSTLAVAKVAGEPRIFVGSSDRCVHAIHAKSSRNEWNFPTQKYIVASPAVASIAGRPSVFVNSLDNGLYVLDAETGCNITRFSSGDMLWPYETRGISPWSSPSVFRAEGKSVLLFPAHDGKLYAFTHGSLSERQEGDAEVKHWQAGSPQELSPPRLRPGLFFFLPPMVGGVLIAGGLGIVFLGKKRRRRTP